MSVPTAKFAFQISAHEAFNSLDPSSEKILASRKEQVVQKNGAITTMTIFFAADKTTVTDMQENGVARSNRQTMEDFKRFCMATQKGLSAPQFAKSMRNIKEMAKADTVKVEKNFADQIRIDYDASIDLPFGLFAMKFAKASEKGLLVRVDDQFVETEYKRPEKKIREITNDEAARLRRKLAGAEKALKPMDMNQLSPTDRHTSVSSKSDRKEKTDSTPARRHSISREKHINPRHKPMGDAFISSKPRETQATVKRKEPASTDTQISSGTTTTTNTNTNSA